MSDSIRNKMEDGTPIAYRSQTLAPSLATTSKTPEKFSSDDEFRVWARDFAYKRLPIDVAQKLEDEDFMIGKPFPARICTTQVEIDAALEEAEASGELTEEEMAKAFPLVWKNVK
ncbi:MAG: hypothetical protein IJP70_07960 [Bacteroidales bacterium]|nr:hypothetical protein [Bacteroidales bacterium]